ncbi:hypothetical protein DRH14_02400, partial [Candidatus Shapirobacteria bacterium]
MSKKIVLLLTSFVLLWSISINQSLWLDEAISANIASRYSYSQIVNNFSLHDFHPPGHYFLLKFWTSSFGNSVLALRTLSLLFALISIYFIYLIGGLWPAIFLALNPLFLYYAQENRMYAMVSAFLLITFYFLQKIKSATKPKFKQIFLFNLFIFLSFLTFYGSIFFILTLFIYSFFYSKNKTFLSW